MKALNITIKGLARGIGFRPFIFKLAHELGVNGFIKNTSDGAIMVVEGNNQELFIDKVRSDACCKDEKDKRVQRRSDYSRYS